LAEGAQDPLCFLDDAPPTETSPEPSTTSPPLASGGQRLPQQATGQITIWRQEPSEPGADWSGDLLREQADKLRHQGRYEQAISKYQAAQDEYRQEIQQEPATKAANQAAIRSVEQSISICQEELGS